MNINFNKPLNVYASYSKNKNINEICTSGGVVYEIEKNFIKNGGVVWAVKSNSLELEYVKCTKEEELKETVGSKYFQSKTGNAFEEIILELSKNQKVMFVGTPCLVGALLKKVDEDLADNLYTIDLVCHGTPSGKLFEEYSKFELGNDIEKISKVTFRDKKDYVIRYYSNNNMIKEIPYKKSYYLVAFLDGVCQNEGCYSCRYARSERIGDITLGDFWGLSSDSELSKNTSGVNLVLVNSQKGLSLFDSVKSDVEYEERTLDEAISANHQLSNSLEDNEYSKIFRALQKQKGNMYALTHYNKKKTLYINMRRNKTLYSVMSKIPYLKNKM